MRDLNLLSQYLESHPVVGDYYVIPTGPVSCVRAIATTHSGWDHVSVSLPDRCPSWEEMKRVKELFFLDDEPAFQIFPAKKDYVNCHPHVLHWWRPQNETFPLPDKGLVF